MAGLGKQEQGHGHAMPRDETRRRTTKDHDHEWALRCFRSPRKGPSVYEFAYQLSAQSPPSTPCGSLPMCSLAVSIFAKCDALNWLAGVLAFSIYFIIILFFFFSFSEKAERATQSNLASGSGSQLASQQWNKWWTKYRDRARHADEWGAVGPSRVESSRPTSSQTHMF